MKRATQVSTNSLVAERPISSSYSFASVESE